MLRNIEIKLLDKRAEVPVQGSSHSAGVDLIACIDKTIQIPPLKTTMIGTGLAVNMMTVPENLAAFILPRSGKGTKEGKVLGNLVGLIDMDYTGELKISLWNRNSEEYVAIEPGEKIAQLVFLPIIVPNFKVVSAFSNLTERGEGGFGSTDNVKV